ncbi:hypothetical protein BDY17DRAFT_320018 [Neohortaea acidophila]|uniref:BRCT domain-containing protein n=1 Tax=Neohortaea acidophila TaxID=245834 RepID=A0A6A6Q684_9PEZI|nr:uncharacterized protein BDY17DRAFT_320018 [Neohortaea acidophila]KAF2487476.1 hypothetical protein BDY17DRAFT_320018 [Neohortaea acidophila]
MPPKAPRAAEPRLSAHFDAFNSSATGHQRAENRLSGSTLWRDSRHLKLREQFRSGHEGGKRIADTVGAGSDGSVKMGLLENGTVTWRREQDQLSLQESLDAERARKRVKVDYDDDDALSGKVSKLDSRKPKLRETKEEDEAGRPDVSPSRFLSPIDPNSSFSSTSSTKQQDEKDDTETPEYQHTAPPQIFHNLAFYINGSTAPVISDHKLKRLLTEHGAGISIALGRRTVTHVILGRPASNGGAGGGLAGSKIHKEISAKRGESVKYVTAEWVLESVKAGKRLPESKFEALRLAPKGVGSVAGMFGKKERVGKTVDHG